MRAQLKHYLVNEFSLKILTYLVILEVFLSSRWNVDPYHEGSLVPSSVGMAQGKVIFRDVNNQYGSLVALFNAPFHFVFGNALIVSRFVSACTFLLIAYLTYILLRKYISKNLAHAVSLLWLLMSPTWAWFSGHGSMIGVAWPNHFAIILSLISFIILRKLASGSHRHQKLLAFTSGACAFLVTQARFELYSLWIVEFAIIVFFTFRTTISKSTSIMWTIGSLATAIPYFAYLSYNHAFGDWYSQTILVWFSEPPDLPVVNFNFFLFNFAGFFLLIGLFGITFMINSICAKFKLPGWLNVLVVSASLFAVVKIPLWLPTIRIGRSFEFKSWSSHVFDMVLFSPINVAYLAGAILILFNLTQRFIKSRLVRTINLKTDFDSVFLAGMAIGFLSLTHNFNAPYTGITIAPLLGYIASVGSNPSESLRRFWLSLSTQLRLLYISFALVSSVLFIVNLTLQTSHFQTPLLKGITTFDRPYQEYVDERFAAVNNFVRPGRMWMMCQTGLYTVSLNGYMGADEWSWNQQPEKWMQDRPLRARVGDSLVTCHLSKGENKEIEFLKSQRRILPVYSKDDFVIYKVIEGAAS